MGRESEHMKDSKGERLQVSEKHTPSEWESTRDWKFLFLLGVQGDERH